MFFQKNSLEFIFIKFLLEIFSKTSTVAPYRLSVTKKKKRQMSHRRAYTRCRNKIWTIEGGVQRLKSLFNFHIHFRNKREEQMNIRSTEEKKNSSTYRNKKIAQSLVNKLRNVNEWLEHAREQNTHSVLIEIEHPMNRKT